jgi:hypothetical protein
MAACQAPMSANNIDQTSPVRVGDCFASASLALVLLLILASSFKQGAAVADEAVSYIPPGWLKSNTCLKTPSHGGILPAPRRRIRPQIAPKVHRNSAQSPLAPPERGRRAGAAKSAPKQQTMRAGHHFQEIACEERFLPLRAPEGRRRRLGPFLQRLRLRSSDLCGSNEPPAFLCRAPVPSSPFPSSLLLFLASGIFRRAPPPSSLSPRHPASSFPGQAPQRSLVRGFVRGAFLFSEDGP